MQKYASPKGAAGQIFTNRAASLKPLRVPAGHPSPLGGQLAARARLHERDHTPHSSPGLDLRAQRLVPGVTRTVACGGSFSPPCRVLLCEYSTVYLLIESDAWPLW